MAQESNKATERRSKRAAYWNDIFGDNILDVGPGDDVMVWPGARVTPFDKKHGDANKLDDYMPGMKNSIYSFSCVHGSQVMEHLYNPGDFINRCLKILKPGGWIVMTVPDYDLYEKGRFPSQYNPDHKTTWSLWRRAGHNKYLDKHIHVPTWIKQFDVAQRYATLIDTNYDFLKPDSVDQTWLREDGVEAFIEILLQKKP